MCDPDETPVEIVLPVPGPAEDDEYDDDRRRATEVG